MNKLLKDKRLYFAAILFVFLLATLLRVYRIDQLSFWRDEAVTIFLAKVDISEMLRMTANDTNAPLMQFILHYWIKVFGEGELFVRLLPLLFSLGIILYVYLLSRKYFSKFDTLMIVLLNSVLFISIFYAREVRAYSMLAFFMIGGFYHGLQYLKSSKIYHALAFIFLNSLAFYTHNTSILFILVEAVYFLYILFPRIRKSRKALINYSLLFIGTFLLSLPWLIIFVKQTSFVDNSFWLGFNPIDSVNETITGLVTGLTLFTHETFGVFDALHNWVTIILLLIGTGYEFSKFKKQKVHFSVIFWGVFLLLFLISFKKPMLYMRYAYFIAPFMIFVVYKGIKAILKKKWFVITVVVLVTALNLITYYKYINATSSKPDYNRAVAFVLENISDKEQVVHLDALSFFSFKVYSDDTFVNTIYDPYDVTPTYIGKAMTYEEDYTRSVDDLLENESLWFVKLGEIRDEETKDFKQDFALVEKNDFDGGIRLEKWEKNK